LAPLLPGNYGRLQAECSFKYALYDLLLSGFDIYLSDVSLHGRYLCARREVFMKFLFRFIGLLLLFALLLAGLLVVNTLMYAPEPMAKNAVIELDVDIDRVTGNLSRAVQFKTISYSTDVAPDKVAFEGFIDWLAETYPNTHGAMERRLVNGYSLLFKWQGSDASLKPVLLTGHYDVVPVTSDIKTQWSHPPFDGVVADKHVWGRGTLDDKGSVITMFEAAEKLIEEGFSPKRTLYFAIGHDEEIGGNGGAGVIVELLKSNNVQFAWSLDEGSMVLDNIIPGLPYPVASINLAEKGFLNVELVARGKAGHSSMPPKQTAIGAISRAINRLQNAPVPGGLDGVSGDFFDEIGRYFSFGKRIIFANRWLFGPLLERELSKANTTNALLRTTTAPTIISGGVKDNILPAKAVANINFRLHPRDTVESIVAYVVKTIDDENVTVKAKKWANEASSVASHQVDGYKHLAETFKSVYGEVIVLPGLTIAGTDSAHYSKITDNSYRIIPMQVNNEDIAGFHGPNEKLSLINLKRAVTFYHQLIKVAAN